jgi:hypothetical protein
MHTCLQVRAVDSLGVDNELPAAVVEDEDADAAAARLERAAQARVQATLLNHGKAALDIAGLGDGDDGAVLNVQNTVLLEDGAEHRLNDDTGSRVGDSGRLLVELLGEQVDTEVSVLAGGSRCGDADDLRGAALQDQDVASANVMAGDGDSVGHGGGRAAALGRSTGLADHLNTLGLRVEEAVSRAVDTLTEGVVVTWWFGQSASGTHDNNVINGWEVSPSSSW